MLNRLDSEMSKELLGQMQEQDATLVEALRHFMFVFDDIMKLDQTAITEILARVDRRVSMMALKGTSNEMKQHFLQCMSERARQMMLEDMEAIGPVKVKDVEAAQQEIIAVVRKLEAEGVVNLRGGGDEYVV
jgi:flagellar motor switch protein FliG